MCPLFLESCFCDIPLLQTIYLLEVHLGVLSSEISLTLRQEHGAFVGRSEVGEGIFEGWVSSISSLRVEFEVVLRSERVFDGAHCLIEPLLVLLSLESMFLVRVHDVSIHPFVILVDVGHVKLQLSTEILEGNSTLLLIIQVVNYLLDFIFSDYVQLPQGLPDVCSRHEAILVLIKLFEPPEELDLALEKLIIDLLKQFLSDSLPPSGCWVDEKILESLLFLVDWLLMEAIS